MVLFDIADAELGSTETECAMVIRANSSDVSQSVLGPLNSKATAKVWYSSDTSTVWTS
jgi:hypothetical protein